MQHLLDGSLVIKPKGEKSMLFSRIAVVSAVALSFSMFIAEAQTRPSPERLAAIHERMANMNKLAIAKLPPNLKNTLSGGPRNFLQFAAAWPDMEKALEKMNDAQVADIQKALQNRAHAAVSSGPVPVSNPAVDFLFSVLAGFTQSETSTAWCSNGVVVGFNDSGSFFESLLFGPGGISFSGAGASTDGGNSFRDIGFINPGPNVLEFLEGDPVVNCADASTFYYSQIAFGGTFEVPTAEVDVSKSTDGGFTWDNPIPAVSKDAFTHFLDKDWSAIDHKNPKNIYVSYTDFDFSGFFFPPPPNALCPNNVRVAIEIVRSTDGGTTWSAPTVVAEVCSAPPNFPELQNSQIAVGSGDDVYVEWEVFPQGGLESTRELRIARSTNHAASFGPSSLIDTITPTGNGFDLQGNFRTTLTGNLTIDRSGTNSDGFLYVTWEDGRFRSRLDLESPTGLYYNANVLISRSLDHGKTWSAPVRINNDPFESAAGVGIDHFQPGVAVDATGALAVCWYDRREDPLDYQVTRFCGTSTDHAERWNNLRVDPSIWPPIHDTDVLIVPDYLGDYDTVATDSLKTLPGFQGAYGNVTLHSQVANQDVFLTHVNK
jgi:hypothetical protein